MIKPSKVKDAFKKVENENYAFRVYLKNHADFNRLDEQFLELHNELFTSYDCSKCRNCCKAYSANLEKEEIELVATFLKMTKKEFVDKYIKTTVDGYQLNVRPCSFLSADVNVSGDRPSLGGSGRTDRATRDLCGERTLQGHLLQGR